MTENDVMTPKSCESCTFTMVSTESEPCYSCRGMRNYTKDIGSEHESLRELNRELVEAGQACVSAWNSVCDSHGWERDHLVQFPALSALIAKARGEK